MSTKSSSISKNEIEKFTKISNHWWKKDGSFKILHQINPIRVDYIIDKIKSHFNMDIKNFHTKLDILDVGCGGGLVTSALSKVDNNYKFINSITGMDAIQNNIDVANKYAKKHDLKVNYITSTVEQQIENPKTYDVILCLEVIEHVENIDNFIDNLVKLLKPTGMIIISTINRTIKSYIQAIFMAEFVLDWVEKNTHNFSKFLKPSELYSQFNKHNMKLKELKGLTYNIIGNNWQLSNDVEVNYFAYFSKS